MTNDNSASETLRAWNAQLEKVRQKQCAQGRGQAGLANPEQLKGKTGLQVMTALLNGELPRPYMADTEPPRLSWRPVYVSQAGIA